MPPVLHGEGVLWNSPQIASWAVALADEAGGYRPGAGAELYNDPDKALGPAYGVSTDVLVLGEGGQATLAFGQTVTDQEGSADFAVFENGILDPVTGRIFAELARVGVASRENAGDEDFAYFPAFTDNTEPVPSFGKIDPALYRGLAGRHPGGTGTAFDLQELKNNPKVLTGTVDLSCIRYIRILDVVGNGSELDDSPLPRPIYDPFPTWNPDITVNTAGFDLDGVALLDAGEIVP